MIILLCSSKFAVHSSWKFMDCRLRGLRLRLSGILKYFIKIWNMINFFPHLTLLNSLTDIDLNSISNKSKFFTSSSCLIRKFRLRLLNLSCTISSSWSSWCIKNEKMREKIFWYHWRSFLHNLQRYTHTHTHDVLHCVLTHLESIVN